MSNDPTEDARRARQIYLNEEAGERPSLEAAYGKVWDTDELRAEFEVTGFLAPFVGVKRKADNKEGSMEFQHHPRFYFNFKED